jgi:hypothetical protein
VARDGVWGQGSFEPALVKPVGEVTKSHAATFLITVMI